ncbi:pesticidal protein Cry7Aa [Candidatus Falkowbacteria bacterium]|nr:pesticidal protein Cry7Aa [Candidatus Falkowbacteria bacterium]
MIKLRREGILLEKTRNSFENKSVLNPGVVQDGKNVHVVYRAIDKNFVSSLGYARLEGPTKVVERWNKPFLYPKFKYESRGIEDPRITKIDDVYYLVYIVHDGKNCFLAYSYGKDILNLKRGGIISPTVTYSKAAKLFRYSKLKDDYYFYQAYYQQYGGKDIRVWDKDGCLFPEKVNGKFILMHRILPDIQIADFHDFKELKSDKYWTEYMMNMSKNVILENAYDFEERHLGGGAPPIKTKHGWLVIYHGTEESNHRRIYRGGAALFDLEDPTKLLARLPYPILSPEKDYELRGHVSQVVFPTGTSFFRDRLYIYYGAADSRIAVASVKIDDLLEELRANRVKTD